ncbi:hypothetical protein B0H13DRAFT_1902097 [Mycena leptocephala]|nr:hypothetical protein B0H13DRAFT_1902097 [Mycena leptocephala]
MYRNASAASADRWIKPRKDNEDRLYTCDADQRGSAMFSDETNLSICSNIVHLFKVVLIKTRTPPHIKHKQKAVSPLFNASPLPIPSSLKTLSSLPHPLIGRRLPTCSKHDGRLLCICISCVALVSAAFRYVPFQTMSRCLSCRGKADDDDFGSMKFPAANSAFTPDSERIRLSTSSFPVQVRVSPSLHPPMEIDADPYAAPPPLHVVSLPPPGYVIAARTSTASGTSPEFSFLSFPAWEQPLP